MRRHERAGWAPTDGSCSSRRIFQQLEGSPWEVRGLNPMLDRPAYIIGARKEPRQHPAVKSYGFLSAGRNCWGCRDPYICCVLQNLVCSHLPWDPAEGEQSGLETLEKTLGLVALGRELKKQLPGSLCWVIPHTAGTMPLSQSTPLWMASAWGKQYPHLQELLHPTAWLLFTVWLDKQLISLMTKAENTKKQPKWEDKEIDPKSKNKRILQKKN